MFEILTDAGITVNNESVAIISGSVEFDEGFPEYDIKTASVGGGGTEPVFSQDVSTGRGAVRFKMHSSAANIERARQWKASKATNVVGVSGKDSAGQRLNRTLKHGAILENYTVSISPDGEIQINFAGDRLV